jgi:hypothetical protein
LGFSPTHATQKGEFAMTKKDEIKVAKLQQRLDQEFSQVVTTPLGESPNLLQLFNIVSGLGLNAYLGKVAFAGQTSSGIYRVQFETGNTAYSTKWPQWAFDLAKSALLNGKMLLVISNGIPIGSNLLEVYVDHLTA